MLSKYLHKSNTESKLKLWIHGQILGWALGSGSAREIARNPARAPGPGSDLGSIPFSVKFNYGLLWIASFPPTTAAFRLLRTMHCSSATGLMPGCWDEVQHQCQCRNSRNLEKDCRSLPGSVLHSEWKLLQTSFTNQLYQSIDKLQMLWMRGHNAWYCVCTLKVYTACWKATVMLHIHPILVQSCVAGFHV